MAKQKFHFSEAAFLPLLFICLLLLPLAPLILIGMHMQNKEDLKKAAPLIDSHALELAIRKKQLLFEKNYGLIETKFWTAEKVTFIRDVLLPQLDRQYVSPGFAGRLDDLIEAAATREMPKATQTIGIEPLEYEEFVASMLRKAGWEAHTTKASGDQGIDVIAEKNGYVVVLQCKMQTAPVGTSAVQQIIAGRAFKHASGAAVISTAGYTRGARQLAAATGVLLLHEQQLSDIDSELTVH